MRCYKRRQALLFAGLLVFLTFFVLIAVGLWSVPSEIRLQPGETGRLRVSFPFSLRAPDTAKSFLAGMVANGRELAFQSTATGTFDVELRLLGAISLRRVAVAVVPQRNVILGGQAIGVLLASSGVVVVGHQTLRGIDGTRGCPAQDAGVQVGDVILAVNGQPIEHVGDLTRLIDEAFTAGGDTLGMTIRRRGREMRRVIKPMHCLWPPGDPESRERSMIGLYVEDPAAGVGTLTFYAPETGDFAALGHQVSELGGQRHISLEGGSIVAARISGIQQGRRGNPGEKIGTFSGPGDIIGTISDNTTFGLFGRLSGRLPETRSIPVAMAHQVHPGSATILTVVKGESVQEFAVEIVRVYRHTSPHSKGLVLRVTDPRLLETTGGIIQGMSGSPIVQDGRLAGAVTHVFVNDPTLGYGVLAEWMLMEMDTRSRAEAA